MKKNKLILSFLIFLANSCTAEEKVLKDTVKKQDFSHLKIQTILSEEDKKYYEKVHNQISEIGKHFAYREESAREKYCPLLQKMFDEISLRPISRERERLMKMCYTNDLEEDKFSEEEMNYLERNVPNSSVLSRSIEKSVNLDEIDLTSLKNYLLFVKPWKEKEPTKFQLKYDQIKKEYCQKAVELKQWDHIYYLTQVHSPIQIIGCLTPESEYAHFSSPCCREAMKLAVKGWSKENLYDPEFLNPNAEEISSKDYDIMKRELRNAILKATGRDLDKEP